MIIIKDDVIPNYPAVCVGWYTKIKGVAQYEFVKLDKVNPGDIAKLGPTFEEDLNLLNEPVSI